MECETLSIGSSGHSIICLHCLLFSTDQKSMSTSLDSVKSLVWYMGVLAFLQYDRHLRWREKVILTHSLEVEVINRLAMLVLGLWGPAHCDGGRDCSVRQRWPHVKDRRDCLPARVWSQYTNTSLGSTSQDVLLYQRKWARSLCPAGVWGTLQTQGGAVGTSGCLSTDS